MKELLKYSKNLENDFVNPNPSYQSKIDLAISSLVTGDYHKAKSLFDSAIEIDSQFPSAWLGKAFSEIASISDEEFNSLAIDEYLSRAMRSTNDIAKYKVAIAGCLAFRHAEIIKKSILLIEQALKEKEQAQKNKNIAAASAIGGAFLVGRSKSITSNVIGGTLITGGAAMAYNYASKEAELDRISKSVYSTALSQTFLSTPIIHLCGTLLEKIEDNNLQGNFNVVLDAWKDSVIYLYNKQRVQLVEKLKKFSVAEAENVQKLLKDPNSIQEVGEFVAFMNIIGLDKHLIFDLLNKLFKETLPGHFGNPEALQGLDVARKKQNKAYAMGGGLFVLGCISIFSDYVSKNDNQWLPWFLDISGIIVAVALSMKAETNEMKEFQKTYSKAINDIDSIKVNRNDIDLNLIG